MAKRRGPKKPNRGKNLKKTSEGFINKHGVEITLKEKRALESAVVRANKKRREILKMEAAMPRMLRGKQTGQSMGDLMQMGYESDFAIKPKSKSLHQFKSREEFERYMRYLGRVNEPGYIEKRMKQYQENHASAIVNELGDKGLAMKVKLMDPKRYNELVQQYEDDFEIHYIYGPDEKQAKINKLRDILDMEIRAEPPIDGEFYNV